MEKCIECNCLVVYDGERVNSSVIIMSEDSTSRVCIDCADDYFAKEEIKSYKQWCKVKGKKVDRNIIEQIKRNEL
jgi:hypothetical protein